MYIEDFSVSHRTGCRGLFWGHQGLSFYQRFLNQQQRIYVEDVSVSHRSGCRGWFLGHKGLSFCQRFLRQLYSMCAEDVNLSPRTTLLGWFLRPRVLVFVNGFWSSSSLCTLKISASAVKLGFENDLWDSRDSVFVKGFSVNRSLYA